MKQVNVRLDSSLYRQLRQRLLDNDLSVQKFIEVSAIRYLAERVSYEGERPSSTHWRCQVDGEPLKVPRRIG